MYALTRKMMQVARPRAYGIVPVLALALMVLLMPPDGHDRSAWMVFAGQFHLLTIHFPIALLFLVPILELAGAHRQLPHLKASVEFVLVLALAASLFAAALGWSLARSGGYSGHIVTQHMWGGIFVAAACWLCWMLRARLERPRGVLAYWVALIFAVALVSWTGYRGGQLTQGENHLTEGMPEPLRAVFGIKDTSVAGAAAPPNRNTFYGGRVEPIFAANCYSCHGGSKQRGQLRLDSYASIMHGGKHGKVIVPGDIKASEMVRRIHLPQTDNDAMPPQGKRSLTPDEIKVIELWIAAGASETLPLDGIKDAPTNMAAPKEVSFPEIRPEAINKLRAAHADAVAALQKRYPGLLDYESRTTEKLSLNAFLLNAKFGDSDLAAFKPVLGDIVAADFSNTAISDHSASLLAAMKNIRMLRLAHTKITDATMMKLGALIQLESLNILDTAVTFASIQSITQLPKLEHVYVAETKITPSMAATPELKKELVF